ncbi:MAG: hypothetical protein SH868_04090 [Bythopirellula sp.]|nr:hypothetical protein [Bythopirellula sp.]
MNPWLLRDSRAQLQVGPLRGQVDLINPALGVNGLAWNNGSVAGNLFGVTVAQESIEPSNLSVVGLDKFVRGDDLVANYPQTESQPFTLHIYWRLTKAEPQLVILDAIVSLQTSLLECFPKVMLTTNLPATEAWQVTGEGAPPSQIDSHHETNKFAGILLREAKRGWSYLEVTHPDDLGSWQVDPSSPFMICRELGGEFQEKGVIRRLRVRGAFFPSENDLEIAARLINEFAASPPPLTA